MMTTTISGAGSCVHSPGPGAPTRESTRDCNRRTSAGQRFPLEPLQIAIGSPNNLAMARRLGVHARQLYRWRSYGLDEHQADRAAIRCGLHPALVWAGWLS